MDIEPGRNYVTRAGGFARIADFGPFPLQTSDTQGWRGFVNHLRFTAWDESGRNLEKIDSLDIVDTQEHPARAIHLPKQVK